MHKMQSKKKSIKHYKGYHTLYKSPRNAQVWSTRISRWIGTQNANQRLMQPSCSSSWLPCNSACSADITCDALDALVMFKHGAFCVLIWLLLYHSFTVNDCKRCHLDLRFLFLQSGCTLVHHELRYYSKSLHNAGTTCFNLASTQRQATFWIWLSLGGTCWCLQNFRIHAAETDQMHSNA